MTAHVQLMYSSVHIHRHFHGKFVNTQMTGRMHRAQTKTKEKHDTTFKACEAAKRGDFEASTKEFLKLG
jgi:hypothetical protein